MNIEDKIDKAIEDYERKNLRPARFIIVNGYTHQRIVDWFSAQTSPIGLINIRTSNLEYNGLKIANTHSLGLEDSIEIGG